MHCVDFFFFLVVVDKVGPYYGHFSRFFRSKLSIYLQNYVKSGLFFVHNLITFSIVFTLSPPPIITKVKRLKKKQNQCF